MTSSRTAGGEPALAKIAERFGPDVATIVAGCSDTTAAVKEEWRLRKDRYLAHLELAARDVLLVSASDKLHNARSILEDLREHGEEIWTRFNRGPQDQLWYYGALRDVFLRRPPGRLADELDRTVRDINRLLDLEDRVEWLRHPFELWWAADTESGATVDWPGCPLIVVGTADGVLVRAEVGRGGDYAPDADDDLDKYIDADLGGMMLEYVEPAEVAWLICRDEGDLREACARVAGLAPTVAQQLCDSAVMLDPPIATFAERVDRGPW
jgi:hypothetical protein